jgi:5,10-methylenetetrahydromethanopterin reductase
MSRSDLPRLGIRLHGGLDPLACIALAQAAEANGFHSAWFAENPFQRGVLPAVSAAAALTSRMRIGIGVVNPYNRHPTLIAMEFAALDELAQGRALLGIGSGIGAMIERMGFAYDRPVSAVRDAVHIVRAMLRGETVSYRGRVFSVEGARLSFQPPRPDMPIYMAAMGDRSIRVCGEIADGLMVSNMTPPAFTERAIGILRDSASAVGREPPAIVQYVPCVARPDAAAARVEVKSAIAEMLRSFWPASRPWPAIKERIVTDSLIARADFAVALERLRRGDPAMDVLDDRFVAAFAIAGTAEDCLSEAARYRRAGVDELVLTFAGGQPADDIAYLGATMS